MIGNAAVHIGNHHAIDEQREPRANFALLDEVAHERVAHAFEAGVDETAHVDDRHRAPSPRFQMMTSSTGRRGDGAKSSPFVYATGISATWNQLVGMPSTSAISV